MPINLFYELKKYEDIFYADPLKPWGGQRPPRPPLMDAHAVPVLNFPIQHFRKEICRHSNGNKLHKVPKAISIKQARGESATQISSFKMYLIARAY